jgi:predicted TIM-barrel fold metal-dependent hydrolase
LIVAHANQLQFEACFKVVGSLPNVYTDIVSSGFPYGLIERMVKAVGSEKVLFGTDVPYLDPVSQWGKLAFARLDDGAKENIYLRNAEKIRSRI